MKVLKKIDGNKKAYLYVWDVFAFTFCCLKIERFIQGIETKLLILRFLSIDVI